jgi:hypothetical protein
LNRLITGYGPLGRLGQPLPAFRSGNPAPAARSAESKLLQGHGIPGFSTWRETGSH